MTETLGCVLALHLTPGNVPDRDAARPVVERAQAKAPSIECLSVDGGYAGQCVQALRAFYDLDVRVVRHPGNRRVGRWHNERQVPELATGFVVLPKRWVVERIHAWNLRARRLIQDPDRRLDVATAWLWLAEGRRLLRQLVSTDSESET